MNTTGVFVGFQYSEVTIFIDGGDASSGGKQSKRVFVIEDEQIMARTLELKLNRSGFEAKSAFDGADALKVLESEEFDLILLDLVMPKVDGFGVLSELKTRGNKTPIIIISNLGQEEDIERAKKLGASEYYVKSYTSVAQIIEHVKEALNA
jgi:DNA-binding response OmpR family regulator